jgi:site-specific DNA-methyltransferase (adenine-specific)
MSNLLYYGDNLGVLREHIADESVDLVYLDPPFNSNASYNVLFRAPDGVQSQAQIEAFDDTWHWTESAENAYWEVLHGKNTNAARMLEAMRGFLGENDMMAYLAMMAIRLIELHRVLKSTGSLYLHCDPTASHYLKLLLDAIFGAKCFRNEIIWRRNTSHNSGNQFGRIHDTILFYSKSQKSWVWNWTFGDFSEEQLSRYEEDEDGRLYKAENLTAARPDSKSGKFEWRGSKPGASRGWAYGVKQLEQFWSDGLILTKKDGTPRLDGYKVYLDSLPGAKAQSIWTDILRVANVTKERLGYPTQKPVALLERILSASSNPGDVVLDPFCGCGTTVHAAQKLGRQWIGIDVTHLAISLIERRLRDAFGKDAGFQTIGVPKDLSAAKDLALRDKHEFEKWAITLIPDAQPFRGGKKGADTGIDGIVYLRTGKTQTDKAIIEVKGGGVSVDQIHKLKSVIEREKAMIGLFVTLEKPTKPMIAEAAAAGFVETTNGRIPRIQILTIEGILNFREVPRLPVIDTTAFKKAPKEKQGGQSKLDL